MVNPPPIEGNVVRKPQEVQGLMTECAALWRTGADGPRVRDVFPQLHMLLPVRQTVCDLPAGEVEHVELGELVLQHS